MPTANINGTTIAYRERGQGAPLVLLHGFPHDSTLWDEQLDALSATHRVIAPDLRGFGQSGSGAAFTIESLADDVHRLLESIGALPCVLGGLSMGGYVALAFSKKYPAALSGLVLVDTQSAGDTPEARQQREQSMQLAQSSGSRAIAQQMLPKMLTPRTIAEQPDLARQVTTMMENCPPQTIVNAQAAMRDRPDRTADLPSIACPTLIIVGDGDKITPPAVAQKMREAIPNARLAVIADAAHLSPLERPEEVNEALREFLMTCLAKP